MPSSVDSSPPQSPLSTTFPKEHGFARMLKFPGQLPSSPGNVTWCWSVTSASISSAAETRFTDYSIARWPTSMTCLGEDRPCVMKSRSILSRDMTRIFSSSSITNAMSETKWYSAWTTVVQGFSPMKIWLRDVVLSGARMNWKFLKMPRSKHSLRCWTVTKSNLNEKNCSIYQREIRHPVLVRIIIFPTRIHPWRWRQNHCWWLIVSCSLTSMEGHGGWVRFWQKRTLHQITGTFPVILRMTRCLQVRWWLKGVSNCFNFTCSISVYIPEWKTRFSNRSTGCLRLFAAGVRWFQEIPWCVTGWWSRR